MSYTIIDNDILRAGDKLKPNEFRVLLVLMSYCNKEKGFAYPSHKDLKRDCAIKDKGTLIKVINELEEKGYITKETVKGKGNKYYINNNDEGVGKNHTSMEKPHKGGMEKPHHTSMENPYTINTNTNTNINTIYIDEVWNKYPKKQGKAAATKKIPQIIKSIGKDKLIECIDNYIEYVKETRKSFDLQYMNGSTFFNGRYLDFMEKEKAPALTDAKKKTNYSDSICKNQNKYTEKIEVVNNFARG